MGPVELDGEGCGVGDLELGVDCPTYDAEPMALALRECRACIPVDDAGLYIPITKWVTDDTSHPWLTGLNAFYAVLDPARRRNIQ